MFNILPPAINLVKTLCPEVDLSIDFYPQNQQIHTDEPLPIPSHNIKTRGIIQTTTPSQDGVIAFTINSPRHFRIYLNMTLDTLAHIQIQPTLLVCEFMYNNLPTHARVYGFKDYRYNGWVALLASQASINPYNPHPSLSPDITLTT